MTRIAGVVAAAAVMLSGSVALAGGPDPKPDPKANERDEEAFQGDTPLPEAPTSDIDEEQIREGGAKEKREALDDDKLQIGGLFYPRTGVFFASGRDLGDQTVTANTLIDLFLDKSGYTSDRVRMYVRGRLIYTPTGGQTQIIPGAPVLDKYTALLDQAWIKWDVARRVYLTLGAQHVRWGTSRLWNPVEAIYAERRDPLTLFDTRTGVPMFKVHVPIERLDWNVYAIALADRAVDLSHVGAAGRLEMVLAGAAVGLTATKRKDIDPRFGVDLSTPIWDLDFTGEVGLEKKADGWHTMSSAGLAYSIKYSDQDSVQFGAEYFFNPDAQSSTTAVVDKAMSWFAQGMASAGDPSKPKPSGLPFAPFYTGRHYAALYLLLMSPGSWNDTTFTLSAIQNLSDKTGTVRLDCRTLVLTDITLELYGATFFGDDGEFRFYAKAISARAGGVEVVPRPIAQVGVNLRMSL